MGEHRNHLNDLNWLVRIGRSPFKEGEEALIPAADVRKGDYVLSPGRYGDVWHQAMEDAEPMGFRYATEGKVWVRMLEPDSWDHLSTAHKDDLWHVAREGGF